MKICVVGTGYVGLVLGACLSDTGRDVICVDTDESKVETLRGGTPTIYEPGLAEILERCIEAGRLHFTTELSEALAESDIVFVAVGTPPLPDGSVDMSAVHAVAEDVARLAQRHMVFVMKSTVPVGTHKVISDIFAEKAQVGIDYVSNPEFLKEGNAIEDFTKPDRVVIGAFNEQAAKTIAHLYGPFMRLRERVILTDPASAELAKYACNAMLATRVSFMNEISQLCDSLGANVDDIRRCVGSDSRIGSAFLFPGIGYGGFCFPKDVQALVNIGQNHNVQMRIARATHDANLGQVEFFKTVIDRQLGGDYQGRTLGLWGLAYKARTDDTRMSAAVKVAKWLAENGAVVKAHDPQAIPKAQAELGDAVTFCQDMYEAIDGAEALLVLTDWQDYRSPDFERIAKLLTRPVVIDGRNLYEPAEMRRLGMQYHSVGRPSM